MVETNAKQGLAKIFEDKSVHAAADAAGLSLRLDHAITETVLKIASFVRDGVIQPEAIPILKTLLRLYLRNSEFSPYFPICGDPVSENSINAAAALYSNILTRLIAYRKTFPSREPDYHMGSVTYTNVESSPA